MYNLLDGLKIIEASSFVASPTAGLYCAQFGAHRFCFIARGYSWFSRHVRIRRNESRHS